VGIFGKVINNLYIKIKNMGSFKGDIQATRFTSTTTNAIVAGPIRLRGIIVASDGTGAGSVTLKTTSSAGSTLFVADVPSGDVINFSFPEDGILFPKGIFTTTLTKITAVTLLTDKYSGPGLTA
jgi:hypothetical protein